MSNAVTDNYSEIKSNLSRVAQAIAAHDYSKKATENVFKNLANFAVKHGCKSSEAFYKLLEPAEEEVLAFRESKGEKVKTKTGKWMRSKVSQSSTYSSNKHTIGKALDNGIPLLDNTGAVKGKTAIGKEYAERNAKLKVEMSDKDLIKVLDKRLQSVAKAAQALSAQKKYGLLKAFESYL